MTCLRLLELFLSSGKQPHFIHRKDDGPFAFAGLWEHWADDEEEIESGTIIVTEANELLQPLHDRMPVIVDPQQFEVWLDPDCQDTGKLQTILQPNSSAKLEAYPVSRQVNNPRHDEQDCINPLEPKE